ncbi:MAG TPA: class III lanthionine synthetase LanKC [Actinophytocola sp.]|uniref:class III lanthionine synthetase LanKC n=1 Tax=Actinophytocola sp. TaxID=1872138 RepID=UPI002DBD4128|nr:class III lanthionine synthetase LanKC [Actinophytocola sp.]HEU5473368.1 class III lanthionine synthetase LanKC [Actinophytocola sp.]
MSTVQTIQLFCLSDREYYETPSRLADAATRYPSGSDPVPPGWQRFASGLWIGLRPERASLPEQGWKIHVATIPKLAEATLGVVSEICLRRGAAFKFLRSEHALRFALGKYMPRPNSGKFITIYPAGEQQFSELVSELDAALGGNPGPYILSDLRIGCGPVYVRYGAFVEQWCARPDGSSVPALRDPSGVLVPDERGPVFRIPHWVRPPGFLRPHLAARAAAYDKDFPYRILRALHFTNAGGVYLAEHRDTGQQVVLREARPHSGLDAAGTDAFTRLRHEYDVLTRLAGLEFVPQVYGLRTVWEHQFLIEEHIEGTSLLATVIRRNPLRLRDPSAEAVSEYLRWVDGIVDRLSRALDAMHERGMSFGDVHPANVIVRPDDSVALVDFEYAGGAGSPAARRFGAPGFMAPPEATGAEADRYSLRFVWLMMLLPLTELADRDPGKVATLENLARWRFGLGPDAGPTLPAIRHTSTPRPSGESVVSELFADPVANWPAIRDRFVAGILHAATPDRADRLFPADPRVFDGQGAGLGYGAAGVLRALHRVGAAVPEEHIDWLVTAAWRGTALRGQGLFDGPHGVAAVLAELGRRDDALELLAWYPDPAPVTGLYSGQAGVALNMCHFAAMTGDDTLLGAAAGIARRLDSLVQEGTTAPAAGLLHGLSGAALLQLRLYRITGERRYLRACRRALGRELTHCVPMEDGSVQVRSGHRHLLYLDGGSGGIALVAREYLAHQEDPELDTFIQAVRRGCGNEYVREPGLFQGRAGLLAILHQLAGPATENEALPQIRRLAWHAVHRDDTLLIPGRHLRRFSADLATGSAGVLLALHSVFSGADDLLSALLPAGDPLPVLHSEAISPL